MNDELDVTTIDRLVQLGTERAAAQAVPGGNVPYVLVPEGHKVQPVPELIFNDHAARPERIKAHVSVLDAESFAKYWKDFADEDSAVFADEPGLKIGAILDWHQTAGDAKAARWCQHRLTLNLRKSEEWNTWTGKNNQAMSQMAFSEFLEQNGLDIVDPSPATMAEVARDLEAKSTVEFVGGAKTSNGQVILKYSETITGKMGNGSLEVPEAFKLSIPVFVGGAPIVVQALLRYRLNGGKLSLHYSLIRPEAMVREAFGAVRDGIAAALSISILNGTIPA